MEITKRVLKIVLIAILLLTVAISFHRPHKRFYDAKEEYVYAAGNAPERVKMEIIDQLHRFQEGYSLRDLDLVDTFMEELFSSDNLLVVGTMPDEIYVGQRKVSKLVYSDWNAWGDCTFLVDNAHISSAGDVAWIATIGYVKFDVPRFLVLPLRLSGVLVKDNQDWKFQYMQFQFDLSLIALFFTVIILATWLAVSLISLIVFVVRRARETG